MLSLENLRFTGVRTEKAMLKVSWQGELFGIGLFESLVEMFPEHEEKLIASAAMKLFNARTCETFGHETGLHISREESERLVRMGAAFALRFHRFESVARFMLAEATVADMLYSKLSKVARDPKLKILADDLHEQVHAIRDWYKSELDGESDHGEKIFAYLARHGITREEAVKQRKISDLVGGDAQQLVLGYFASEDAADQAFRVLKSWEKVNESIKLEAIDVLIKDKSGHIKEHKESMLGATVGGGVISRLFHKGLRLTTEDVERISQELEEGHAAVGIRTWDFERDSVADKLRELGGRPQTYF